ncbi:hypothetical protein V5O48_005838 [Marasmius crinis-equi]|uniref:Uncharacterized protein n=1 Tax=Marasmius crinis-equi TaxID=585013 RepID=A0ABR3FL71_9AGAR
MSDPEINNTKNQAVSQAQADPMATLVLEQISASIEDILKKIQEMDSVLDQALAEKIPGLVEAVVNAVGSQLESRHGDALSANNQVSADAQAGGPNTANTTTAQGVCQAQNVVVAAGSANAIVCQNCGHVVPLAAGDERWYCVWRARRIGWVKSSDTVIDLTRGVKGAAYKFCASEDAARAVFLNKQEQKVTAVLSDHEDVSFTLPVERGCLFP